MRKATLCFSGPLPLGVVGWDFTFVHFYQMIVDVIRECSDEDKRYAAALQCV